MSHTSSYSDIAVQKFDAGRAAEYETQCRIGLAGYDACHQLAACLLSACLPRTAAHILVGGAGGTGQEIICCAKLQAHWTFAAVDPSPAMLDLAMERIRAAGLASQTNAVVGDIDSLPFEQRFDGAMLSGVLHHLNGEQAKRKVLGQIAARVKPGAPLIMAGNCQRYSANPLFLSAWAKRWQMHGASEQEVELKMAKIQHGAEPPASEAAVTALLEAEGFTRCQRFFSSLFWGAWICFREGHQTR